MSPTCFTANLATAAHLTTLGHPILRVEPEEGRPGYVRFVFSDAARKDLYRYLEVRRDIHRQLWHGPLTAHGALEK